MNNRFLTHQNCNEKSNSFILNVKSIFLEENNFILENQFIYQTCIIFKSNQYCFPMKLFQI